MQELYSFCKRGLLDVVLGTHDLEGNLCATGKGLRETRELQQGGGFKTLDIAAYTYEALLCLAELAEEAGDAAIAPELREKARRLRDIVNTSWWIEEEGLYGDIYTSAEALSSSHQALRAEMPLWRPGDLIELEHSEALLARFAEQHQFSREALGQERPWLLKHMIAATPMETGLASPEHAEQALTRLESSEFNGPWGIYLNPETERVTMTLPDGIMATAEAQYRRIDQSLAYGHKIAAIISQRMPGAFSEVSPDGGCFIQAWSSYGIIWPVVHYFLGFRPDAAERSIRFIPHLPSTWRTARLQDVRVGSASMNLQVVSADQETRVILETNDPLYEITLGSTCLLAREPRHVSLNGEAVSFRMDFVDDHSKENGHPTWCVVQAPSMRGLHRYELLVAW